MNSNEIREKITEIKRMSPNCVSNIIAERLNCENEFETICMNDALAFVIREKERPNLYFIAADDNSLISLLKVIPFQAYCDVFFKNDKSEWDSIMKNAGWEKYARYYRTTVVYNSNPNEIPMQGRKAILQEMYDPCFGEYPEIQDIPELMSLFDTYFDSKLDDYYDKEDWEDIIKNKECLIHKEDGSIVTVFVYRIENNRLYNSMILNLGPANWSYNLERRVFDSAWNKGIRIQYWWTREDNTKAVKRQDSGISEAIKTRNILFNEIYTNVHS